MARIENSLKSAAVSVVGYVLRMLMQLVSRTVFVYVLGKEYLGFSSLFSEILYLLNAAEFGIGACFLYSMYKPIAEGDKKKLGSLMSLYGKTYRIIGCVTGVVSLAVTPFLRFFIKEMPDVPHFQFIYLFYAANTTVSYFFNYKRSIISADQKQYIVSAYTSGCNIAMQVFQILILLLTGNYFLYLGCMLAFTVIENVLLSLKAEKMYPYIMEKKPARLPKEDIRAILDQIGGLICSRLGTVVITSCTTLIISMVFGLEELAVVSNYIFILTSIKTISNMLYNAIAPSVGNMNVLLEPEEKTIIMGRLQFFTQWFFGFCTICLICLFNPFIKIWLGMDYLLPMAAVIAISINFYFDGMRQPVNISRSAMGLHIYMRYMPLIQAVLNVGLSVLLGMLFGVAGVYLGTIVTLLGTSFWSEALVLYNRVLFTPVRHYFLQLLKYAGITALAGGLTMGACYLVPDGNILWFVVKMIICVVAPNVIYFAAYGRSTDFKYYLCLVKKIVCHKKEKIQNSGDSSS